MDERKKIVKLFWLFACGIIAGALIGAWMREWLLEEIIMIFSLFLQQLSQINLADKKYLIYVLRVRGIEIAIAYGMLVTGWYQMFWQGISFLGGLWCGIAIFGITFWKGAAGIFLFLLWIFPHLYLYGFGGMLLQIIYHKKGVLSPAQWRKVLIQINIVFAAGVLGEIFVQPYLARILWYFL